MKQNDNCSGCSQKDSCRLAYEKLGKAGGQNITPTVVVAFIVPMAVFILSVGAGQWILNKWLEGAMLTLVCFAAAFSITVLTIFLIRIIRNRFK